ncbi:uncharacterized protein IUM83_05111 [Phytophthora cinnamomi]|uniref:uncharacterized protein n=1 Tax=Phytophthora cinnamomi TaxID=4785 RepID=UPI0035599556|nr:hypothetical protein IUM83_05111 [Phytophthora cinnamomi]
MSEPKRKDTRTHLTLQQKAQLRDFLAANPKLPRFAVGDWVREHFHVRLGRTTLYRIQHTPEAAFATGNLSRKKLRRVKFPDFERRLLAFYEDRRARREDVPDDELLRHAAECRAACGISDAELKLSNGWLYRFKIRHQLTSTPPPREGVAVDVPAAVETAAAAEEVTLSARALTTVQAPGFFNWEPVGDVQQDQVAIIADGVLLLQPGVYELSVRVRHSAQPPGSPAGCIFKVYCGDRVAGQCEAPTQEQGDVADSIWMGPNLLIDAQESLKVEFLAPGYAFSDSSLVLRRRIQ